SLSQIVGGGNADWVNSTDWGDIPLAPERGPVPGDRYLAHAVDGRRSDARTGTSSYKVTFEILEGTYKGRRVWLDIWLTEANKGHAVRALGRLGTRGRAQLARPLPRGIRCEILVALRRSDDGNLHNEVREFQVVGIDPPPPEPFAPPPPA